MIIIISTSGYAGGYKVDYLSQVLSAKIEPEMATYRRFAEGLSIPLGERIGFSPRKAKRQLQRMASTLEWAKQWRMWKALNKEEG